MKTTKAQQKKLASTFMEKVVDRDLEDHYLDAYFRKSGININDIVNPMKVKHL